MWILALEFSSRVRTAAVWDSNNVTAAPPAVASESATRATPVFSLIETALRQAGTDRAAIQRVAVGLGPGSAMGIRAAIAVAQGWHLARGVSVVGANSLEVLAAGLQAGGLRGRVHLVTDAQRGEWHLAGYELEPTGVRPGAALRLVPRDAVLTLLRAGEPVLGPDAAQVLPGARDAFPDAATLARLAARVEPAEAPELLEPVHLRAPTFAKATPPASPGEAAGLG